MEITKSFESFLNAKQEENLEKEFLSASNFLSSAEIKEELNLQELYEALLGFEEVKDFQTKCGIFLSAFSLRKGGSHTLALKKGCHIDFLGSFLSSGEITIKGDAGDFVGAFLNGAKITVEGSV
ncbi:MAG: hypothetical protein N2445_08885, partial [Acidobacteria bacterium]|nr:hypothetical protein [Acidobacteriota bacterium]